MHPRRNRWLDGVVLVSSLFAGSISAQDATESPAKNRWVNISDPVIDKIKKQELKFGYPGLTGGIAVDEHDGAVYIVACGQGLWKSTNHGDTFARCDGDAIGGRCETGYSLNLDPAGKRLACFMLDGTGAMSLDSGATWQKFTSVGRNWDYAAVGWEQEQPRQVIAAKHESGGEFFISRDAGQNWKLIFHNSQMQSIGIFDDNIMVTNDPQGLIRSQDKGKTWIRAATFKPISRVMRVYQGNGWWISENGLVTSKDKGLTWNKVGSAVIGSLGPYFDPADAKHVLVGGSKGFFETTDGAMTWNHIADLPEGFDVPRPGWFTNIGWDPKAKILYASRMGKPAFKLQR